MKIWFQALSQDPKIDPTWRSYDEACVRYVPTLARPDTTIHFASTDTRAPKMVLSNYVKYLHLAQVIENAIQAEREGYDAFIIGGMGDLGYAELREVVDIPVVFIGETSLLAACMVASKFAIINNEARALRTLGAMAAKYGVADRMVPGGHMGYAQADLSAAMDHQPHAVIEKIKAAAAGPIEEGAEILVPGIAPISVFLAERGIRDIDGVPVLDIQAAVIKTAEMLVDFRRLGMPKPAKGKGLNVSRQDAMLARRIYGIDKGAG